MTANKVTRYDVPGEGRLGGWGVFFVTPDGFLSVVSDYGNYGYHWSNPGMEFRQFLVSHDRAEVDYLCGKLSPENKRIYDGPATLVKVKRYLLSERRLGSRLSNEDARVAWQDMLDSEIDHHAYGFDNWYADFTLNIDEPWELKAYQISPQFRSFAERLFPRFQAMLKAELEREASEAAEYLKNGKLSYGQP